MKVELLIADDKELRASVRELIKSEVLNMARKDIKEIIASAIGQKLPDEDGATKVVEGLFREEVKTHVRKALDQRATYNDPTYIQKVAREEVRELIKDTVAKGNVV